MAAVSFARSERGQRMLRDAKDRLDTPANRAKLSSLTGRRPSGR